MRPKLKPDLDLESITNALISDVCGQYTHGVSVRALAKKFELSPMKVRKILITGGCYSTDLSTEIDALYKDGKTVGEIAELLNTTPANVYSYLPYERVIYNMDEKSVEADRQQRYRDRKKGRLEPAQKAELPIIERVRNKTLVFVIGKKLRAVLPKEILDDFSDPLSRDITGWGDNAWDPADPAAHIWCAELVTNGRGKNKKQGIMLQSANCGFAVCMTMLTPPTDPSVDELRAYRNALEKALLEGIKSGMLSFCLPEESVLNYTDTVARVELVKGKATTPMTRLEGLIGELKIEKNQEPSKAFRIRSNFDSRKFGNSPWYRRVDEAVCKMLRMSDEEEKAWLDRFMAPVREKLL